MQINVRYTAIITAVLLTITLATMQFWLPYLKDWLSYLSCMFTAMDTCCGTMCCEVLHP